MINLPGNLYIRSVRGREGGFSVGRLVTEIGEFVLRDEFLHQYGEGHYQGEFGIAEIYPASYVAGGRLVVEVRATLASLVLALAGDLPAAELQSDVLPPGGTALEAPADAKPQGPSEAEALPPEEPKPEAKAEGSVQDGLFADEEPQGPADNEADAQLFGTLWPLGDEVRLDTTVGRALFRRQKERLKVLGFTFQASSQIWLRA
jgi:hypothetical protein